MSEAQTPGEGTIQAPDDGQKDVEREDEYDGPDPEEDEKGDGADEDQGT